MRNIDTGGAQSLLEMDIDATRTIDMRCLLTAQLLILCLFGAPAGARAESLDMKVPNGFEVTLFADSSLANDIYCLTIDPKGRVVVASSGYIRILVDDDKDGKADRAVTFADSPKDGAMGMLWEKDSLYFTGDGGLRRFRDENDDSKADAPAELIRKLATGTEHGSHAIRRGPDGWLYVLCGNATKVDQTYATLESSPVKSPIAGSVLRLSPDFKSSEIVADGFRNPYDMDFNSDGELFTYDSDNERCVSLPWYEFTRFYHVMPGGHYGWESPELAETWRYPPYFFDVVAPASSIARGSPTGVVCYKHTQFPAPYRGGFFILDWTFGKIFYMPLMRAGSSYISKPEVFLEPVGDSGFAPTDAEVDPATGDIYVSIGGRGTKGSVFRIRYVGSDAKSDAAAIAKLQPTTRSLEWNPEHAQSLIETATTGEPFARRLALETICRHWQQWDDATLRKAVHANWEHSDRYIRQATAHLVGAIHRGDFARLLGAPASICAAGVVETAFSRRKDGPGIAKLFPTLPNIKPGSVDVDDLRTIQIAAGGLMSPALKGTVWEGYSPRRKLTADPETSDGKRLEELRATAKTLVEVFPTGKVDVDRELSRTFAMFELEGSDLLAGLAARITEQSDPLADIHYLICLARVKGARSKELTRTTAHALLCLDRKIAERGWKRDSNWPRRIHELHVGLAAKDRALNDAILADKEFGRSDHTLFVESTSFDREAAARLFLARVQDESEYAWSSELIEILAALPPDEIAPVLREQWENLGLHDAIVEVLARRPQAEDRERFLSGLGSPRLSTVEDCLEALKELPGESTPDSLLALVLALRRLPPEKAADRLRGRLVDYLRSATGQAQLPVDKEAWTAWYSETYPQLAARLAGADAVDVAGWKKRLAGVPWDDGDAEQGAKVFTKTGCVQCHSGVRAVGPDLTGVAGRFSRDDLLTAIVQPSRDISERYRTTLIATQEGTLYQGVIIYEAADGLILQTGPDKTARVARDQIAVRRIGQTSLMPAGLLDKISDQEIADLNAYLKTLGKPDGSRVSAEK